MTLPRTLEPEVMDSPEEALDYDAMDHGEVNRLFVDDFLHALAPGDRAEQESHPARSLEILDAGTGTALIPIELCRRPISCHVTAIDLAEQMLKVASRNVAAAGLENRIRLEQIDSKAMPYPAASFDAVMSNSIIHHIPQPKQALAEMFRVLRPGGTIFVRDLLRPDDLQTVERLVALYAGGENEHQQQMFRDSLHAALTLEEIRQILDELGLPAEWAAQTTDRHWTVLGRR